jgi:hypothetical protein
MFHFSPFFCGYLFFQFKGNIYRVELMHYAIFHPLNQLTYLMSSMFTGLAEERLH